MSNIGHIVTEEERAKIIQEGHIGSGTKGFQKGNRIQALRKPKGRSFEIAYIEAAHHAGRLDEKTLEDLKPLFMEHVVNTMLYGSQKEKNDMTSKLAPYVFPRKAETTTKTQKVLRIIRPEREILGEDGEIMKIETTEEITETTTENMTVREKLEKEEKEKAKPKKEERTYEFGKIGYTSPKLKQDENENKTDLQENVPESEGT